MEAKELNDRNLLLSESYDEFKYTKSLEVKKLEENNKNLLNELNDK